MFARPAAPPRVETYDASLARAVADDPSWLLGLLVACRMLMAAWLLRQMLRRGLSNAATLWRWLASWLLIAAVLFGLLAFAVPADLVPVHYLLLGVLIALPMVRLAATPLALAWNRHR